MPRAEVAVRGLERAAAVPAVVAGDVDAALVDGAVAPTDPLRLAQAEGLAVELVGEEPLAVLLPPGHPLAGRDGVRLADLTDALWLDAPGAAVPLADLRAALPAAYPVGCPMRAATRGCCTNWWRQGTGWRCCRARPRVPARCR